MLEKKQHVFSTGNLYVTPLFDYTGAAVANPTPRLAGTLQDVSVEFSRETKELFGQYLNPVEVAVSSEKISGSAKVANINAGLVNAVFFNRSLTSGITAVYIDTTGTAIPAATGPYTIEVDPPSSGTYANDLGVVNSVTGKRMTRVASAPATGQYSVDVETGIYTFAAADAEVVVLIDYEYTATSASSVNIVGNAGQLAGNAGGFKLDLYSPYKGGYSMLTLYNCISTKFAMAFKNNDFMIPDLAFSASQDSSGRVYKWSTNLA